MKYINISLNIILFFFVALFTQIISGQEPVIQIFAPKKLDTLLKNKIALDRVNSSKKQYTIQVFYGNFESTNLEMERFKKLFPDLDVQLIFQTPNYKIRTGNFLSEREAKSVLIKIKRKFRSAFVLKPNLF